MKVKLFLDRDVKVLENRVNEFLSVLTPQQVININYQGGNEYSEIMVVYNE